MIYDRPRFRPGGDRYVVAELGDEMSLDLSFTVQIVGRRLDEQDVGGIIETAPCFATLLISYDPDVIAYESVCALVGETIDGLGSIADLELESRLFYFPVCYFDPWTRECWEDYCAKITEKRWDPELLVAENGLSDLAALQRTHSGPEYWIAALGFWPGLASLTPLDPRAQIYAPKYDPPRTWTPAGTIGFGGGVTCIYPVQTPGGFQMIGRTPVPIWDLAQRAPVFQDSVVLLRPGDRVKFVPIDAEEFREIEARVAEGTYLYNVAEYQSFSMRRYTEWLATLDRTGRY